MSAVSRPPYQFGPFELRTAPPSLSREGQPIGLTPKALATLLALVSRHGEMVSKADLLATVWADTAVEEASLAQNIYTLRKLLAVDFPEGNAIENIPRFGYRFNPAVETREENWLVEGAPAQDPGSEVTDEAEPKLFIEQASLVTPDSPAQEPDAPKEITSSAHETGRKERRSRILSWVSLAFGALCLAAVLWWQWQPIGALFHQQSQFEAIRLTSNSDENRVTASALAPDGNLMAYADADGILLRGLDNAAAKHLLQSPKLKLTEELSWFPDQLHLIASGENADSGTEQIWKVSVLGEAPVLLRDNARMGEVSHYGTAIAFLPPDAASAWVMGASGENARPAVLAGTGKYFSVLLWDARDAGLILERRPLIPDDMEVDAKGNALTFSNGSAYVHARLSDGRITAEKPGLSLGEACLVGPGSLIYSVSTPSEGREAVGLWRVDLDAETDEIKSSPKKLFASEEAHIFGFTCSQDGKRILALRKQGSTSIYVADFDEAAPQISDARRLSMDSETAFPRGWSADNGTVIYEALRGDLWQIYSQSLARHDPDAIVSLASRNSLPTFTADHQWILFKHADVAFGPATLYRVAGDGSKLAAVPADKDLTNFRCPLLRGPCLVLTHSSKGKTDFSVLDPLSGKGRLLVAVPMNVSEIVDWDVAPDGSALVIANASNTPLQTVSLSGGKVVDLDFHSSHAPDTVRWAANGAGFFVAVPASARTSILYVTASGKTTLLRTAAIYTWVTPSPNGKRLAFVDASLDSNLWLASAR